MLHGAARGSRCEGHADPRAEPELQPTRGTVRPNHPRGVPRTVRHLRRAASATPCGRVRGALPRGAVPPGARLPARSRRRRSRATTTPPTASSRQRSRLGGVLNFYHRMAAWSATTSIRTVREKRLREELAKLHLEVNEEKSRVFEFKVGTPLEFLGYTPGLRPQRGRPGRQIVLCRPQKKKRTEFLREVAEKLHRSLHRPVKDVVQKVVNPMVRGWVSYFRWGNASQDLQFVARHVNLKVRLFATRQRPKRRGGRAWTTWSAAEIYATWGLFHDYRVLAAASPGRNADRPSH